jgi:hypothetical protein
MKSYKFCELSGKLHGNPNGGVWANMLRLLKLKYNNNHIFIGHDSYIIQASSISREIWDGLHLRIDGQLIFYDKIVLPNPFQNLSHFQKPNISQS